VEAAKQEPDDTEAALEQDLSEAWSLPEHTLYAGTHVLQAAPHTYAVVTRIGSATVRGELVRDILMEQGAVDHESDQMHEDAYKVMALLFVIGLSALIWSVIFVTEKFGIKMYAAVLDGLDLLTIAVPPALPAAVTFGLVFAIARLKKKNVYCIKASAVTRAAWLKVMCFDKTGTLTDVGLDVRTLLLESSRVNDGKDGKPLPNGDEPSFAAPLFALPTSGYQCLLREDDSIRKELIHRNVLYTLACCHSLAEIEGNVVGDEVDLKLFELSGFELMPTPPGSSVIMAVSEPSSRDGEPPLQTLKIIRSLDFKSEFARMGVVVEVESTNELMLFVKGAPEIIADLCRPSTVPHNLSDVLMGYAFQGFRVLALASRSLGKRSATTEGKDSVSAAMNASRDRLEKNLDFLGLAVMENRLKPDTAAVLGELNQEGNLRCVMVTGDHSRTALSVARQSRILRDNKPVIVADVEKRQHGAGDLIRSRESEQTFCVKFVDASNPSISLNWVELMNELGYTTGSFRGESREEPGEDAFEQYRLFDEPKIDVVVTGAAFRVLHNEYKMLVQESAEGGGGRTVEVEMLLFRLGILEHCSVFSRMTASDKTTLVRLLKETVGMSVGMCGDGANDAGALKEATVGVSLCPEGTGEATASLAAPLTSTDTSLLSVIYTIAEGRAAAAASITAFKYMLLYSVIQLTQVCCLYVVGGDLTDGEFLFVDLFLVIPLCIFMGETEARPGVGPHAPPNSLFHWSVVVSCLGQTFLCIVSQLLILVLIRVCGLSTSYAQTIKLIQEEGDLAEATIEVTALFLLANFQYLLTCYSFNLGPPFRKSSHTNVLLLQTILALAALCALLCVSPPVWVPHAVTAMHQWLTEGLLAMVPVPRVVQWGVMGVAAVNAILSWLLEKAIARQFVASSSRGEE